MIKDKLGPIQYCGFRLKWQLAFLTFLTTWVNIYETRVETQAWYRRSVVTYFVTEQSKCSVITYIYKIRPVSWARCSVKTFKTVCKGFTETVKDGWKVYRWTDRFTKQSFQWDKILFGNLIGMLIVPTGNTEEATVFLIWLKKLNYWYY